MTCRSCFGTGKTHCRSEMCLTADCRPCGACRGEKTVTKTPFQQAREAFDAYCAMAAPHLPADEISAIQVEFARWEVGNFGYQPSSSNALGMSEEVGEMSDAMAMFFGFNRAIGRLSHVVLKSSQKIRGFDDKEYAREQIADAIADVWIFGLNLCTFFRIDGGTLLRATAAKVLKRNWKADPTGAKAD